MLSNPGLWDRLNSIELDDPDAAFPFSARLARDNGWDRAYAKRVLSEYLRFAYLAVVSDHEVTPSDEVDQAWHLHLTYTRHYWGPFKHVLGTPLHHGPTRGGAGERKRYGGNYAATLESYRREFGAAPPSDIWPEEEVRFNATHYKRINTARNWILPKPRFGWLRKHGRLTAIVGLTFLGGSAAVAHESVGGSTLVEYVESYVLHMAEAHTVTAFIMAIGIVAILFGLYSCGFFGDSDWDSGCSGCSGCGGD